MLRFLLVPPLFFLAVFAVLWVLLYVLVQGSRVLFLSSRSTGERARSMRMLALHLFEPLISSFVVLPLPFFFLYIPFSMSGSIAFASAVALLVGLALALNYTGASNPLDRHIMQRVVGLWVLRIGSLLLAVTVAPMLLPLAAVAWFGFVWYAAHWAGTLLKGPLAPPRAARAGSGRVSAPPPRPRHTRVQRPGMQAARAAAAPRVVPVAPPRSGGPARPSQPISTPSVEVLTDMTPPIMCPVCQTPAHRGADECPNCGLVFQSRVPSALRNLPDYEVLRPLSSGGMSSVYLARRRSGGELCVLKTLASVESQHDPHWHAEASRCLRQEYNLLMQIDHPNIARKLSWFGSDLLVLEYVPGPTLEQLLEGAEGQNGNGRTNGAAMLARGDVLAYGVCVAEVLDYLANLPQPVVHHDIKPANLIIRPDDGRLVLVDFGSAVLMPEEGEDAVRLDTYGTPGYAAPEQYQGQSSPASDVYGLAATLYHLLTGDDPTAHPLAFPKLRELPDALADVLAAALAHEPQARPTAQQFCDALQAAMLTLNIEKARGA